MKLSNIKLTLKSIENTNLVYINSFLCKNSKIINALWKIKIYLKWLNKA